ncbi:PIG-L family deacetylase [Kitasatospora sp. NPDC127111]|uniref:PIG-L family deacetylase n=1 Tax=Kitasatospora sp. NPDC127111 TaxID=3345363 RepID=UPI00362DE5D4
MTGGLLARSRAAGARTAVVTATWAPGTGRAAELAEALRILGAGPPRLLGYADAGVPESAPGARRWCDVPLDEAVGRLVAHLREFRPDIVVAPDAYGGLSGHPDHVRTHRVTVLAVQAAALPALYPDTGEPWGPSALYLATHPHSSLQSVAARLIRPGRPAFTVPDEAVDTTVEVTPWLDRKVAAILAHRSEVTRGALPGRLAALPPAAHAELLGTEWYVRHQPGPGRFAL